MLVSNDQGFVYYYNNIDGNLGGTFTKVDSFFNGSLGVRTAANLTVSVGDVNNDGLPDMLVGLFSGGAKIYYGSHTPNTVAELENNNSFVCFPNPANTSFEVSGFKFDAGCKIELFNTLGEKMYSRQLQTPNSRPQTIIDVSRLASGLYIVAVSSSTKTSYQKLLVSH